MNAFDQVRRLREVADKLERMLVRAHRSGASEGWAGAILGQDEGLLVCEVFGHAAADGVRRAELRAILEAAAKIGEANKPKTKRFKVTLRRLVTQEIETEVDAVDEDAAVELARKRAPEGDWPEVEDDTRDDNEVQSLVEAVEDEPAAAAGTTSLEERKLAP